jgi:hypothetical protein
LENHRLSELNKEQNNGSFSVGDVYVGKVKKVMPALNAAFVDIGDDKDAFIHYLDLGLNFKAFDYFVKQVNPKDFLSEEILSATSTAKMAELVAKEIYSIRESRNAILRGQADNVPKDGEALKIILKNLEEQENALTAMFKGNTSREKKEYTIHITPGEADTDEGILFRFSSKRGILSADDLSGSPIYYHFENQTQLPTPDEKKAQKAKRPQGIVHSVPGKALLKITNSKETFYEEVLPIAQYGYTEVLVADLFNKGTTTKVTFDPSTGAIRKIDRE